MYAVNKLVVYYSAKDLRVVDYRSIKSMLDRGYTCISSDLIFSIKDILVLSLRARNTNADKIDLISCSRRCRALTDSGCMYSFDERPSGGKYLIPKEERKCNYDKITLFDIIKTWLPYQ